MKIETCFSDYCIRHFFVSINKSIKVLKFKSKMRDKKFFLLSLGLTLYSLFCANFALSSENAKKIFRDHSSRVVLIKSEFGSGTGFIPFSGTIITNRHVIFGFNRENKGFNSLKEITLKDGKKIIEYERIVCSKIVDICMILVDQRIGREANSISSERKILVGEEMFVIGHPAGLPIQVLSTGVVSSELALLPSDDFIFGKTNFMGFTTNASISPGSSGSPVFSSKGEWLGIVVGSLNNAQNLNIVISIHEIVDFALSLVSPTKKNFFELESGYGKEMNNLLVIHR